MWRESIDRSAAPLQQLAYRVCFTTCLPLRNTEPFINECVRCPPYLLYSMNRTDRSLAATPTSVYIRNLRKSRGPERQQWGDSLLNVRHLASYSSGYLLYYSRYSLIPRMISAHVCLLASLAERIITENNQEQRRQRLEELRRENVVEPRRT